MEIESPKNKLYFCERQLAPRKVNITFRDVQVNRLTGNLTGN